MSLFFNDKKFIQKTFKSESELENLVYENSKKIFGEKSIYIDAKRKINSGELGKTIPDGLLFDFSEKDYPKFYLVEVELAKHSFYNHIFPQITKFFAFLRDGNSFQSELIDFLYRFINSNQSLLKEFKKYLGDEELFKFLKDVIDNSTDILILIDDLKNEFKEIKETYTDTWDKYVRVICINSFVNSDQQIIQINPDFEVIKDDLSVESEDDAEDKPTKYTEEYHLDGVKQETKTLYYQIKQKFSNHVINPQHYYISIRSKHNFVFIQVRKSKIKLVVMLPIEKANSMLKHHKATEPSIGVQRFYNGKCTAITVESNEYLEEIISLLQEAANTERVKIAKPE